MRKRDLPFFLLFVSLVLVLIVREVFRDGMFVDGLLYSSVAKNLAHGIGSFWHPHFSKTVMPVFHEQPPLLFGIQALFYKAFGDSIYVERAYAFLLFLLGAWMLSKTWKLVAGRAAEISWFPMILWVATPVIFWSYSNCVEEITMGFFVLCAVYFILKALDGNSKYPLLLIISAAAFIILSSLCKGIQGLFPLSAVFFHWIVFRKQSFGKMFLYSGILFLIPAIFYFAILQNKTVYASYEVYFRGRLGSAFDGSGDTTSNRFQILLNLFQQLLPAFVIIVISAVLLRKKYTLNQNSKSYAIFFFVLGLSGTLPLMVTLVQREFYIVTALPFFIFALSLLCADGVLNSVNTLEESAKGFRIVSAVAMGLFIGAAVFTVKDLRSGPKRDRELLHDVYTFGKIIPEGSIVSLSEEMFSNWSLHNYMNRLFYISLEIENTENQFYIIDKQMKHSSAPPDFQKLNLQTVKFDLYTRNKSKD
jgi:hypothetical protein